MRVNLRQLYDERPSCAFHDVACLQTFSMEESAREAAAATSLFRSLSCPSSLALRHIIHLSGKVRHDYVLDSPLIFAAFGSQILADRRKSAMRRRRESPFSLLRQQTSRASACTSRPAMLYEL
jgi:hypothetical protein